MPYDTDMTFTLGKNNKGDNPKRPDYRGELILGGKTYLLSGWIRENKAKGTKFISGRVQLKESRVRDEPGGGFEVEHAPAAAPKPAAAQKPPAPAQDLNEDVPF